MKQERARHFSEFIPTSKQIQRMKGKRRTFWKIVQETVQQMEARDKARGRGE